MENIKKLILEKGSEAHEQEVCEAISKDIIGELNVDLVSIWKFNDTCTKIVCEYSVDQHKNINLIGTEYHRDYFPIYFKALLEDVVIRAEDVRTNPKTVELNNNYNSIYNICSALDYVIYARDKPVAVLCCAVKDHKRNWKDQDVDYLRVLTVMAGAELKKD